MRSPLTLLPKTEFHIHIEGSLDVERDRLWRLTAADMLTGIGCWRVKPWRG